MEPHYVGLYAWLLSPSTMSSMFVRRAAWAGPSLLFTAGGVMFYCTDRPFVYLLITGGRWRRFPFWLLQAKLMKSVFKFLRGHVFISLRYIPRSGIPGSPGEFLGPRVTTWLRNCRTVFQGDHSILRSH